MHQNDVEGYVVADSLNSHCDYALIVESHSLYTIEGTTVITDVARRQTLRDGAKITHRTGSHNIQSHCSLTTQLYTSTTTCHPLAQRTHPPPKGANQTPELSPFVSSRRK